MAIPLQHEPEIEYPDSDGKPMAESQIHLEVMLHCIGALQDHFADEPDVYVSGNMLLYYEEGKRSSVAPDVFVARVPKEVRDVYLLWREREAPCFVLEVTSKSTRTEDQRSKKALYARLGVEEYFLFDPRDEYLLPRFQGLRLVGGEYQPMRPAPGESLTSRTIGISFQPQGRSLRLTDVKTGRPLLTYTEWKEKARAAEERAARAEERAEAESVARKAAEERAAEAEARARVLAEEIERLREGGKR
jgi:Uma2 family endonuclease